MLEQFLLYKIYINLSDILPCVNRSLNRLHRLLHMVTWGNPYRSLYRKTFLQINITYVIANPFDTRFIDNWTIITIVLHKIIIFLIHYNDRKFLHLPEAYYSFISCLSNLHNLKPHYINKWMKGQIFGQFHHQKKTFYTNVNNTCVGY